MKQTLQKQGPGNGLLPDNALLQIGIIIDQLLQGIGYILHFVPFQRFLVLHTHTEQHLQDTVYPSSPFPGNEQDAAYAYKQHRCHQQDQLLLVTIDLQGDIFLGKHGNIGHSQMI